MIARAGMPALMLAIGCASCPTTSQAATATAQIIFEFSNLSLGTSPEGGVVADAQGRLYGTSLGGGLYNYGTVWRLDPPQTPGAPWTEEILHSFTETGEDGSEPQTPVTLGSDGSVYGTTRSGGTGGTGRGVAFKLANQPGWPITILHNFVKGTGQSPDSGVVFGPFGFLFGSDVGGYGISMGVDYSLSPLGDSTEYKPISTAAQTGSPTGLTAVPGKSLLVGTSQATVTTFGMFYSLAVASNGQGRTTTQYTFGAPPDVSYSLNPPLVGYGALTGSAFGCDLMGGTNGRGGIYQVTTPASGSASESVIFDFPDSQYPNAVPQGACPLVQATATGTIYGITGGNLAMVPPYNDFFQLTPPATPGGAWTEQSLLYFFPNYPDNIISGPSYPMAQIGNKFYVAFGTSGYGFGYGDVVEITVTP